MPARAITYQRLGTGDISVAHFDPKISKRILIFYTCQVVVEQFSKRTAFKVAFLINRLRHLATNNLLPILIAVNLLMQDISSFYNWALLLFSEIVIFYD